MHSVGRRFVPQLESAATARDFVRAAVRGTRIDRSEALLLTSELVNNAIVHAHGDFEVRVDIDDDAVRVAVVNHSPDLLPVRREPAANGGRGLEIIDGIADAWGYESRPDAKLVWFELGGAACAAGGA